MLRLLRALVCVVAFAPLLAHAQAVTPEVRRMFPPDAAEFRDEHNRGWIEINLDTSGAEFGTFGLYIFPSAYELAVGYFGRVAPVAEADGSYRLDQAVPVLVRRPTNEITPTGQEVPMTIESGIVQLSGTLDANRHVASLVVQVEGREVWLETLEPDVVGAPQTASSAVAAYVGEDWSSLYGMYTSGLHQQVSQAEFEQQMRDMTPPGPPVQLLSSEVTDATLRTLAGFVHYTQIGTADLQQPSGRITPVRVLVDVVWESGRWRLFHINIQRQQSSPDAGPAA